MEPKRTFCIQGTLEFFCNKFLATKSCCFENERRIELGLAQPIMVSILLLASLPEISAAEISHCSKERAIIGWREIAMGAKPILFIPRDLIQACRSFCWWKGFTWVLDSRTSNFLYLRKMIFFHFKASRLRLQYPKTSTMSDTCICLDVQHTVNSALLLALGRSIASPSWDRWDLNFWWTQRVLSGP